MRLAFCLYCYTPFGGLERNCLAIAEACARRGHRVTVFTRNWEGERPAEIEVHQLRSPALTNIGLDRAFARALERRLAAEAFDAVIGFNRLSGLDVFYAADPCFLALHEGRPWPARLTRRHRTRERWEREIFAPQSPTEVLVLSEPEKERYRELYKTPEERLHVLPPGLRPEFLATAPERGSALRVELGVPSDALLVLAVGSDFRRKGLDRTLRSLARIPIELRARAWLAVVGAGRPRVFQRLAARLGIDPRVRFLGGRADVLRCYRSADLLVHPAREENTGSVLLEAMSQAVPVIASGECGYAEPVAQARGGIVLPSPFEQRALDDSLAQLLAYAAERAELGRRGARFARSLSPAARFLLAAEIIERAAERKALAVR